MSSLLDRGRADLASSASDYARETLSVAVRDALEEADLERAGRARRRGWIATVAALGVGGAIGYLLRGGDLEAAMEEADVDVDVTAPESVRSMATEESTGRTGGLGRKLLAGGGLVLGLYLLRRRASGPREMVREARQRTGGERAGEAERGVAAGAGVGPAGRTTGATGGETATVGEGAGEPTVQTEREGAESTAGDEEDEETTTIGEGEETTTIGEGEEGGESDEESDDGEGF